MGIYLEQRSGKAIYLNTDEILLADYYPASDGSPSRLNIFFKGSETMKVFIDRQADMLMRSFKDSWDVEIIREGDHFDGSGLILCEPEPELSNPL